MPLIPFPASYHITLIALCAWREARSQGIEGMRAVMHVIRNRHFSPAFRKNGQPLDWDNVITDKNQFSSFTIAGDSQLLVYGDDDNVLFAQAFALANRVYDGQDMDPTAGALYYANVKIAAGFSQWFTKNILEKPQEHPVRLLLKDHTFFA